MSEETTRRADEEVTWSLIDPMCKIVHGRRTLLMATVVGIALGTVVSLVVQPVFTAEAVFMPPKDTDYRPGVLSATSALSLGSDTSSDTYLGLLESRTVQDDVIAHLNLILKFKAKRHDEARTALSRVSKFSVDKNAFVTVAVKTSDPKLSADIANTYLDALYRINGQMVDSASTYRRVFFEEQLEQQKNALTQAEQELKNTQERTGLVFPAGEAQNGLLATSSLQSQINAAEARLAGLLIGGTDQNPQVVQGRSLVNELRGQLARQQADTATRGARLPPNSSLPGLTLEYAQKAREVKLREGVYDTLVQQYEKARLSSIDPGPQLQVVDRAIAPERKSGPSRKLLIVGGMFLGFFASLTWLLLINPLKRFASSIRSIAQNG